MHLNTSTLPSGNDVIEHGISTPALHENLIDKLLCPANLDSAWKRVKANKGSAGIDGMTIDDFPAFANANWENIKTQITQGTYRPGPVLRVNIPKPDGGSRGLGIPTVLDRFIQQAIHQVLNPIFDPHFSPYSFGFRPNCNAAKAVKHLQTGVKSGRKIAVDIDLSKFF